ncbi:NADP-dependent oxidoreductase domain-containing protein [Exophiala viscosa]|uniref:NADP-dependent oxidoreductase domain-containing protein n=1 Tax=Exophiala viscosa TaxID=2486360 RepID=UPI0021912E4D|nr:NADP-dependent oxidoreductase domain-containing protein [Exophiala viscosa]
MTTSQAGSVKLANGSSIPAIGLGTWQAPPSEVEGAVATALREGYRHIDCALIYKNEAEVGEGIRQSGIPREEIFITSKLWNSFHPNAVESLNRSLKDLGTDYLDLYLVHWPVRLVPNESSELLPVNADGTRAIDRDWDMGKTWAQMEDILASGKVKAIGVCNWSIPYLEQLKKGWRSKPLVNQVELHPHLPQHELVEWCKKEGILVEAYSPLGGAGGPILSDPDVVSIAEKHNVSPANVLISYHVNQGVVPLVKSTSPSRLKSNLQTVSLDESDMKKLNRLSSQPGKAKRYNTPLFGWDLGFDDWYGPPKKEH